MDTHTSNGTHGQKRPASDDLDNEQRFTKRFNLLNLEDVGKLYIPIKQAPSPPRRSRSNAFSDSMNLDDTRDRIYIHNLDDEISDVDSEAEKLVFLPDIDKRLTKIPKSVLLGQNQPHTRNEVILYSVPESISIPPEQDNVRKAIMEARERARQKQLETAEISTAEISTAGALDDAAGRPVQEGVLQNNTGPIELDTSAYDEDEMDIG
ncbi:hypothetical protein MMC13_007419 [Lambiella insularis]|nr:hypothetical protein [Lambiella insularis]